MGSKRVETSPPQKPSSTGSADQLDRRMVIVHSRSWILLAVVVGALVLAFAWGVLGSVPTRVSGEGLLIDFDKPVVVSNPTAQGAVVEISAEVGQSLEPGDVILWTSNSKLKKRIELARQYLGILRTDDAQETKEEDDLLKKQQASVDKQIGLAKETLKQTRKLITMYEQEVSDYKALVDQQLVPNSELVAARAVLFEAMQTATAQDTAIANAEVEFSSVFSTIEQSRQVRRQQLIQAENELQNLEVTRQESVRILAPIRGRLIELKVGVGSVLAPGDSVATILPVEGEEVHPTEEDGDRGFSAVMFLPYGEGKRIEKGMPAQISLPFAPPSQYGFIKAKVREVDEFVTGTALAVDIGSEILASTIREQVGAALQVYIDIESDPRTTSGLAWTSRNGYPGKIPVLTLCTVQVDVMQDRPIELVLPWIKDLLGIDQAPIFPRITRAVPTE